MFTKIVFNKISWTILYQIIWGYWIVEQIKFSNPDFIQLYIHTCAQCAWHKFFKFVVFFFPNWSVFLLFSIQAMWRTLYLTQVKKFLNLFQFHDDNFVFFFLFFFFSEEFNFDPHGVTCCFGFLNFLMSSECHEVGHGVF